MFGRTEKSWLEEELERERKGIVAGETWWEKIWRQMKEVFEIFVGPLRRRVDAASMARTCLQIERKYTSGLYTMNEARELYGLPPVADGFVGGDVIFYADNQEIDISR